MSEVPGGYRPPEASEGGTSPAEQQASGVRLKMPVTTMRYLDRTIVEDAERVQAAVAEAEQIKGRKGKKALAAAVEERKQVAHEKIGPVNHLLKQVDGRDNIGEDDEFVELALDGTTKDLWAVRKTNDVIRREMPGHTDTAQEGESTRIILGGSVDSLVAGFLIDEEPLVEHLQTQGVELDGAA